MTMIGHSLPPNVEGELIGTLSICMQECSIADAYARIQFWGEQAFVDLFPMNRSNCTSPDSYQCDGRSSNLETNSIEYPLIGTTHDLNMYLKDASPLPLAILRRQKNQSLAFVDDPNLEPFIVGWAYMPDTLSIPASIGKATKTVSFSHLFNLSIAFAGSELEKTIIGEATFEVIFRMAVSENLESNHSQKLQLQNDLETKYTNQESSHFLETQPLTTTESLPLYSNQSDRYFGEVESIMERIEYESCAENVNAEDQQSLLEELLDLCNDDEMTIPSVDDTYSDNYVDPYESWLSRITQHAGSPLSEDSLTSLGANTHALGNIRYCKLDIDDISLSTEITKSIKGNHRFYLRYTALPISFETGNQNTDEIMVCERVAGRSRSRTSESLPMPSKSRFISSCSSNKTKDVELHLLPKPYSKHTEMVFNNNEDVRRWHEGIMKFELFCKHHSHQENSANQPAIEAGAKTQDYFFIAHSHLRLRDVIASEAFHFQAKLDFVLANSASLKNYDEITSSAGSISVRLQLLPAQEADKNYHIAVSSNLQKKTSDRSVALKNDASIQSSRRQYTDSMMHHPLTILLSSFADVTSNAYTAMPSNYGTDNIEPISSSKSNDLDGMVCPLSDNKGVVAVLKPVMPPPLWMDVRMNFLDLNLITATDKSPAGDSRRRYLRLHISCTQCYESASEPKQSDVKKTGSHNMFDSALSSNKIIELGNNETSCVPVSINCLWQVALDVCIGTKCDNENDDRIKRPKTAAVVIQIWLCIDPKNSSDKDESSRDLDQGTETFIGFTHIPFLLKPSRILDVCNNLPFISTNGWFGVYHPEFERSIGKIQAVVATGTLRQIRRVSLASHKTIIIQRWWRKRKNVSGEAGRQLRDGIHTHPTASQEEEEEEEEDRSHHISSHCSQQGQSLDTDEKTQAPARENEEDHDKMLAELIHQNRDAEEEKHHQLYPQLDTMKEMDSSPDSLFEEWTQRSLPQNENEVVLCDIALPKPIDIFKKECAQIFESEASADDISVTINTEKKYHGLLLPRKLLEPISSAQLSHASITRSTSVLQEGTSHHQPKEQEQKRSQIDPPEENGETSCKNFNKKRKRDDRYFDTPEKTSSLGIESKRNRLVLKSKLPFFEQCGGEGSTSTVDEKEKNTTTTSSEDKSKETDPSTCNNPNQFNGNKEEVCCAYDEDTDDTIIYRSLSSVIDELMSDRLFAVPPHRINRQEKGGQRHLLEEGEEAEIAQKNNICSAGDLECVEKSSQCTIQKLPRCLCCNSYLSTEQTKKSTSVQTQLEGTKVNRAATCERGSSPIKCTLCCPDSCSSRNSLSSSGSKNSKRGINLHNLATNDSSSIIVNEEKQDMKCLSPHEHSQNAHLCMDKKYKECISDESLPHTIIYDNSNAKKDNLPHQCNSDYNKKMNVQRLSYDTMNPGKEKLASTMCDRKTEIERNLNGAKKKSMHNNAKRYLQFTGEVLPPVDTSQEMLTISSSSKSRCKSILSRQTYNVLHDKKRAFSGDGNVFDKFRFNKTEEGQKSRKGHPLQNAFMNNETDRNRIERIFSGKM